MLISRGDQSQPHGIAGPSEPARHAIPHTRPGDTPATTRLHGYDRLQSARQHATHPSDPSTTNDPDRTRSLTHPGTAAAAPACILVVDDTESSRMALVWNLRRQGYTILEAENGLRALALLRSHAIDLVLLDIMMPEMNGYEVLTWRHQDAELLAIPVIVISSIDDMQSIVQCVELGAEDYLLKPFDPVLLNARIGACLEKKRLRDREQEYLQRIRIEQ